MFVDAHVHLDFLAGTAKKGALGTYLSAATAAGVGAFAIPGVSPAGWARGAALVAEWPEHLCMGVGFQPEHLPSAELATADPATADSKAWVRTSLQNAISEYDPCFIGEVGLDARVEGAVSARLQEAILAVHCEVAQEAALPLVFHCVRRHDRLLSVISKKVATSRGASISEAPVGMVHGFIGGSVLAEAYGQAGVLLGVGARAFRSPKTQAALRSVPSDALVLESDEPSGPITIPALIEQLAQLRGEQPAHVRRYTEANARRLFRWPR